MVGCCLLQVLGAMERLDVTVEDVKAAHFKTDDIGRTMQALLGDASLAQHSLVTEQPLGAACLVSAMFVLVCCPVVFLGLLKTWARFVTNKTAKMVT